MCEMQDRKFMVCRCNPENPVVKLNFNTLLGACGYIIDIVGILSCSLEEEPCCVENCPLVEV